MSMQQDKAFKAKLTTIVFLL